MTIQSLSEIYTRIYIDFLKNVALTDSSLENLLADITLGELVLNSDASKAHSPPLGDHSGPILSSSSSSLLEAQDLLHFGTPARYHLDATTSKRLHDAVLSDLQNITDFFRGAQLGSESTQPLVHELEKSKSHNEDIKRQVTLASNHLTNLIVDITAKRTEFGQELNRAISTTLPAYNTARSASIDLLATTIETSLTRLALVEEKAKHTFYDHQGKGRSKVPGEKTIANAIKVAHAALQKEEKMKKAEIKTLDSQLREYETLLELVDGGSGGYQQVVKDWAKVKQDMDECLKDLRRLGWTGD